MLQIGLIIGKLVGFVNEKYGPNTLIQQGEKIAGRNSALWRDRV